MSIFSPIKLHSIKIPDTLIKECLDYLNGKLVSHELMLEIKNLKNQDPSLSKFEIIELILDYHERILRNKKENNP